MLHIFCIFLISKGIKIALLVQKLRPFSKGVVYKYLNTAESI